MTIQAPVSPGTRWLVILEDGDEITLVANQQPTELVVEGVAVRLAKLGKAGYLVSITGPLTGGSGGLMKEERSFGDPNMPFDEVRFRYDRRKGRTSGNKSMGWRY